ncbi:hypothetical protein TNIN_321501 [Trichonephila inaurata madagascariensis]|uniref:Uncharacterized protein n=1 Tax=Trichonephila inaurata madagascariensis TaxID=2747483 RepID=A0A8X7CKN1_9ARAC|nr:hypothetical protein TNIN_321501 [Trichonephila inaurata madagascariensis]
MNQDTLNDLGNYLNLRFQTLLKRHTESDASSRYGSKTSLSEDQNRDYKKLYEDLKRRNKRLKETLQEIREELEKIKKQNCRNYLRALL